MQLLLGVKKIFEVDFPPVPVKYIGTYANYRVLDFLGGWRFKYYISFWLRQLLMKIQDGCRLNMSSGEKRVWGFFLSLEILRLCFP